MCISLRALRLRKLVAKSIELVRRVSYLGRLGSLLDNRWRIAYAAK